MAQRTATGVVFFCLTLAASAVFIEDCKQRANGCSIPLGLPFFYKDEFTPACYQHDQCYRCGSQYGFNRVKCDEKFKANMEAICERMKLSDKDIKECKNFAQIYYSSVRIFANSHYLTGADNCSDDWVLKCITY